MSLSPAPKVRRSKRIVSKKQASLVVNFKGHPERRPCLIVDSSQDGYRLRVSFKLKRGQAVEVILDEDPGNSVQCSVAWVGKAGSKQEGEVGLEIV